MASPLPANVTAPSYGNHKGLQTQPYVPGGGLYSWLKTTCTAPSDSTGSFSDESVKITRSDGFVILALSNQEIKGTGGSQEKQHPKRVANLVTDFSHLFSLLLVSEDVLCECLAVGG